MNIKIVAVEASFLPAAACGDRRSGGEGLAVTCHDGQHAVLLGNQ